MIKFNEQIEDSLQKMKKKSDNNEKLSELKDNKTRKISESNNHEFITINESDQIDKKCQKFYESINLIKKYYKVKKNITFEGSIKTPEIFFSKYNEKVNDFSLDCFKEYLKNISKFYQLRDNIPLENAIDLYFENEKEDILSEIQIYRQINQLSREFDNLKSQEEEEEVVIKYLNEIGLNLEKNMNTIKMSKNEIYECIKKYSEYFNLQKVFLLRNQSEGFDPYLIVKEFDLENYIIYNNAEEAYFHYIVSLYFCYEGYLNYLNETKQRIQSFDIRIRGLIERNIAKNELIEKLKSNFSNFLNEKDDEFTKVWNKMKKRNNFIENDKFLNTKIEEYVRKKDENNFLNDLKEFIKSKNINYLNFE
jgi:hypothetical protein